MLLLALALLLPPGPVAPPKTKPMEVVVALEDRSITLPGLPSDSRQGRAQFKEVHAQISHAMAELTLDLRAMYARPEAGTLLPENLSVPAAWAADGTALLGVIEDRDFLRLERDYLDTWKGWQAALAEGGVAQRTQAPPAIQEPRSKRFEATRQKGRQALQAPSRKVREADRLDAGWKPKVDGDEFSEETLAASPLRPGENAVELERFSKKQNDTQNRVAVTNLLLPDLANAWGSLVAHLNDRALWVLTREEAMTPSPDPTVNTLRLHARLAVLERFRKALWYCDLVWCQIAPAEPPPPPQRLTGRPAPR